MRGEGAASARPRRRWRSAGALVAVQFVVLLFGGGGVAHGAPVTGAVTVVASVDGQQLGTSSQNQPVKLFPRQQSVLAISVTNGGPSTINIGEVRLEGDVVGLTFFAYDTAVSVSVAPGETQSRRLVLDLSGLDGQATGLIPGAVKVLDGRHHVLASEDGVVDVRGSLRSVYGLFGLGVAFLTALSFLGALVGLARHRLPVNRWRRGLRFLTPGLGLGLVVNFTLSATRVFVPEIGRWVTITVLCAVVLFAMGYLTPTPDLEEDEPGEADTQVAEELAVVAIAARPGHPALAARPDHPALAARPDQAELSADALWSSLASRSTDPQPSNGAPTPTDGVPTRADTAVSPSGLPGRPDADTFDLSAQAAASSQSSNPDSLAGLPTPPVVPTDFEPTTSSAVEREPATASLESNRAHDSRATLPAGYAPTLLSHEPPDAPDGPPVPPREP